MKNFQLNALLLSVSLALTSTVSTTAFANEAKLCEGDSCKSVMKKLHKHARYNNPEAQVLLATAYLKGEGVEVNEKKAYKLLKKAAMADSGKAFFMLSALSRDGIGTEKDLEKSNMWLNKAVNVKFPQAMYQKALQTLDFEKADNSAELELLLAAEKKNNRAAMYLMSVLRESGTLVEQDLVKAAEGYKNLTFWDYQDSRAKLAALAERMSASEATSEEDTQRVAQLADGIETITVTGKKMSFDMALDATIKRITSGNMSIYDGSSTGSRIPGACTKKRNCAIISDPDDLMMMGMSGGLGSVTGGSGNTSGGSGTGGN